MRQVPKLNFLLIGNGRAAIHIAYYLSSVGHNVKKWHYKFDSIDSLRILHQTCDRTLLLIKDSALQSFLDENSYLKDLRTIHFSGATSINDISNIHPLISFSNELFPIEFYSKIPFAVFDSALTSLDNLIPGFPNPVFFVNAKNKSLYHGLCVFSGNLTTHLWHLAGKEFEQNFSLNSFHLIPYMESLLMNLKNNWSTALSGPIARKDETTLLRNYEALQQTPLISIFEAHIQLAWPEFAHKYFTEIKK